MKTCSWLAQVFALLLILSLAESVSAVAKAEDKSKTKTVKVKDVMLEIPHTWKQSTPKSRFRAGQFQIPTAEGDTESGELVMYYFGSSGGGSVDANVKRWIGQFQSTGRNAKTTSGTSTQGPYVLVTVTGTYNKPIGPPILQKTKPMPEARMMAVILKVKNKGNYFLKLTGPEKTVTAADADFRKSFGANLKEEKAHKPTRK